MKKIFQLLLLLCVVNLIKAQTVTPPAYADVDNNYRTYVNNVFGALEANRVPTGLLVDYGFEFTDPKIYNGSVLVDSTLMEQGTYAELYKTLYTSRFNTNTGALRHPSIHDSLCYIARQKEVITLSGLLFKYHAIDPNAQATGTMQTINGQLRDVYVNGVWQNPYQEFNTMAISPSTMRYNLTYCSVVLPSNLFLTNRSSEISTIAFDAADGQGYRTISYNTPISLNYADTGWKHWKFRITLTNGQQLYSHSKVHFNNISNAAGSGAAAARGVIDRREAITATEAFNGAFGVADIVISYRNANDPVLRRPLIVAEGFDPGWITNPEEPEGGNTFDDFTRSIRNSGSAALRNLITGNDIFDPNSPSQYDLVYINWRNGTDFLQRNALVLEAVIRWVNANKQPLGGVLQPNVVLGSSMGGVIARMALGRMDRGGGQSGAGGFAAHQTGLYISLDAPHQGANVPLGYQAAARHATRMYLSTGGLTVAVEIIQALRNEPSPLLNLLLADQPASRQMLNNRIDIFYNPANVTNQNFLQELRTQWAYPVNIRNIAISNGSECAIDQEFAPGSNLLYHYRSTKTRFITDLLTIFTGVGLQAVGVSPVITAPLILPGTNKFELTLDIKSIANGGGNAVYYGNIAYTKKVLWLIPVKINIANKTYNAPTGILPLDTYPGGFYTLTLANQPGSVSQDWMFSYNNSFYIQRRFCFIPTTSALDIGQGNTTLTDANYTAKYIGATPPTAPLNTPFDNFTTAFNNGPINITISNPITFQIVWQITSTGSEPHEGLFIRSANWLAEEMNGVTTGRTNCAAFCSNSTITGSRTICNTPQLLTAPFGAGVSYVWSSNSPIVNIAPNGNTALVSRVGGSNGTAIISVEITGPCGTTTLRATVTVGTLTPTYTICGYSPTQICRYGQIIMSVTRSYPSGSIYKFYKNNILVKSSTSNFCNFVSSGCNVPMELSVIVQTSCGNSFPAGEVIALDCSGFRVSASPNPVSNSLNISLSAQTDVETNTKQPGEELKAIRSIKSTGKTVVTLFEFNTNMQVRQWTQNEISSKNYRFNVAGLRKGLYVLQVDRDNQTTVTKIIVE
jgi:Secretion system C-terminal sorting domain